MFTENYLISLSNSIRDVKEVIRADLKRKAECLEEKRKI